MNDATTVSFQGKHSNETFQFYFRRHIIRLIWPVIRLLLWNALLIGVAYTLLMQANIENILLREGIVLVFSLFFLLSQYEFLSSLYEYYLYVVIVTDKKVHRIAKSLVTMNDHQSIDLWMLQDIHKSQHGLLQNALGYGNIALEAQETKLVLHVVPNISEYYTRFLHLREQARSMLVTHPYQKLYGQRKNTTLQ